MPVPSLMVTKVSSDCGVTGSVPLTIWQFAIDTSWPSYDSGLIERAPIVTEAGVGGRPDDGSTVIPYGDVDFSIDSVMSSRCRPPLNPTRPKASTTWPGVVDWKGVGVSVER